MNLYDVYKFVDPFPWQPFFKSDDSFVPVVPSKIYLCIFPKLKKGLDA